MKGKLAAQVIIVMIATAFVIKIINFFTSRGAVEIDGKKFKVEIANDSWEQAEGLSGRKSLAKNRGMLFVFSQEGPYKFWMKGMNFPLDIIWINQGKIVDIKEKAPVPTVNRIEEYLPESPAIYALEINAGLVEKYGFRVGDTVALDI